MPRQFVQGDTFFASFWEAFRPQPGVDLRAGHTGSRCLRRFTVRLSQFLRMDSLASGFCALAYCEGVS